MCGSCYGSSNCCMDPLDEAGAALVAAASPERQSLSKCWDVTAYCRTPHELTMIPTFLVPAAFEANDRAPSVPLCPPLGPDTGRRAHTPPRLLPEATLYPHSAMPRDPEGVSPSAPRCRPDPLATRFPEAESHDAAPDPRSRASILPTPRRCAVLDDPRIRDDTLYPVDAYLPCNPGLVGYLNTQRFMLKGSRGTDGTLLQYFCHVSVRINFRC